MSLHHEFAFYSSERFNLNNDMCVIEDKALVYRINRIVRLKVGDTFILFDGKSRLTFTIFASEQNRLVCRLLDTQLAPDLKPEIHWLIPLLERDAMEQIVYCLAACGITSWTPIVAEKSHRNYLNTKESERLNRIIIAACEQAKQFNLPIVNALHTFNEIPGLVESYKGAHCLFFDPDGIKCHKMIENLRENKVQKIVCMIGPEGDLIGSEKKVLAQLGFTFCALVPTILRAEDACSLASGMLRSLLD